MRELHRAQRPEHRPGIRRFGALARLKSWGRATSYLKFDIELVREIDRASKERKRMLASLVRIVNDLGIASLAEGVESEAEHDACREMGFDFAQGFYYGKAALANEFKGSLRFGSDPGTDLLLGSK
jgi:EAL domain-containing protein (putative c-di-GMP-specific phosphodiesterase class I)